MLRRLVLLLLAAGLGWQIAPGNSRAASLSGEIARSDFRAWGTNQGGTWLNFNQLVSGTGLLNQWTNRYGVTFATTTDPTGKHLAKPTPVVTSSSYSYNLGRITFVGSPCVGCLDDKACDYEIRFVKPQRWAGLQRYWKGSTLTRFYSSEGDLLHEFEGEGFHGWMAESNEKMFWVSRIEITTAPNSTTREVGYSDDLIYGTNTISRLLPFLSLRTTGAPVPNAIPKKGYQVDYRARNLGDTNDFLGITKSIGLPDRTQSEPASEPSDSLFDVK